MWQVSTFQDLCKYGAKYISGEINEFPGQAAIPFEKQKESDEQKEYLIKINKLGFFTVMSQPAIKQNPELINLLDADINLYYQRAYVKGYMLKNDAIKLYEFFKNDPKINVYTPFDSDMLENNIITIVPLQVRLRDLQKYIPQYINKNSDFSKDYNDWCDLLFKGAATYFYHPVNNHKLQDYYEKYVDPLVLKNINDEIVRVVVVDKIYNRKDNYLWEMLVSALTNIRNQ